MEKANSKMIHNMVGLFYITKEGQKVFHRSFKSKDELMNYVESSSFAISEDFEKILVVELEEEVEEDEGES